MSKIASLSVAILLAACSIPTASLAAVPVPATGLLFGAQIGPGVPSPFLASAPQTVAPIYVKFGKNLRAIPGPGYPMFDLSCTAASAMISGADDAWIASFVKMLTDYGQPAFVRFCWEMNSPSKIRVVGGTPDDFKLAWMYLRAQLPANVSMIWAPSVGGTTSLPYFPGAANVDWIGFDNFDRYTVADPGGFARIVRNPCTIYGGMGVPMAITATGAYPVNQVAFFTDMAQVGTLCPAIKMLRIFDSHGSGVDSFVLTPDATALFQAFVAANAPTP